MEVIALVKGEKGLYYSNGEKMFFPDRSWKDAKEGFAEVLDTTNDKGNYAFIKGKMIETVEPTNDVIVKYIDINSSVVDKVHIGDSVGFSVKEDYGIKVYAVTKDGVVLVHKDSNYTFMGRLPKSDYRKRLYTYDLVKTSVRYDITNLYADYLKETTYQIKDKKDFIESCVRIFSSLTYTGDINRISLYGDMFYIVESSDGYFTYIRNQVGVERCDRVNPKSIIEAHKINYTMNVKELKDFMINNHICGTYGYSGIEGLCKHDFNALGVSVEVYAYNGSVFSYSMLEDKVLSELINNSFDKLQQETKRIGKQCTGRLVAELRNLNPRSWLIGH